MISNQGKEKLFIRHTLHINLLSTSSNINICTVAGLSKDSDPMVTTVSCPKKSSVCSTILSSKIATLRLILLVILLKVRFKEINS